MQKVVLQMGALAGIGATLLATKKMFAPTIHPTVAAHSQIVSREPALAEVLSHLASVRDDPRMEKILAIVDEVINLSLSEKKANQWHIARLNGEILRQAKAMCVMSNCTENDATFEKVVFANDEYIPQLEGLLDNILHNYLLQK